MSLVNVVIVDDHDTFRAGFGDFLKSLSGYRIVFDDQNDVTPLPPTDPHKITAGADRLEPSRSIAEGQEQTDRTSICARRAGGNLAEQVVETELHAEIHGCRHQ